MIECKVVLYNYKICILKGRPPTYVQFRASMICKLACDMCRRSYVISVSMCRPPVANSEPMHT